MKKKNHIITRIEKFPPKKGIFFLRHPTDRQPNLETYIDMKKASENPKLNYLNETT